MSKCYLLIEDETKDWCRRDVKIYGKSLKDAIRDNMDIFRHDYIGNPPNKPATVEQVYKYICKAKGITVYWSYSDITQKR